MQPFTARNLPRAPSQPGPRPITPRPAGSSTSQPQSSRPGQNPPRPGINSPRPGLNPPRPPLHRPSPPHVVPRPIQNLQQPAGCSALLEEIRRENQRISSDVRNIVSICQNLRDEYKELMESSY